MFHSFARLGAWLLVLALWLPGARAEVAVPPLSGAVVDLTGTLTADQRQSLDAELRTFAEQRGSQVAVLLVPTTQPESIEQYSIRVADQWKIGRKRVDDGVILVVAKNDRTVRIEVGYGLEGAITDLASKRIIDEQIVPRFRDNDFYGGIRAATTSLMKLIQGEKLPEPERRQVGTGNGDHLQWLIWALFAVLMFGGIVRAIFGRFFGSAIGGGVVGAVATLVVGSLTVGVVAGLFAFLVMLATGGGRGNYVGRRSTGGWGGGGWGGGGWGGGGGWSGGSNGGFSGGGGGFGGGGSSGRW